MDKTPIIKAIQRWRQALGALDKADIRLSDIQGRVCTDYMGCNGCPIFARTKRVSCGDTPYHLVYSTYYGIPPSSSEVSLPLRKAIIKQIEFLESVLEEDDVI